MPETAFSFFRLESHADRHRARVRLAGPARLGLARAPAGISSTCVRGSTAAIFPGVHGRPRADLAAHFQTGRAVALAEFKLVVELPPGVSDLVLEVLEIEGRWSAFQTIRFTADGALPPAEVAMPSGPPLRWHEYGRALQLLLWGRPPRAGAPARRTRA
jgi:hypothetical protein